MKKTFRFQSFSVFTISDKRLCTCIYTLLLILFKLFLNNGSWGSSGSIVSKYRLDNRGSIPSRGNAFFL
jgi:hypothetical protein